MKSINPIFHAHFDCKSSVQSLNNRKIELVGRIQQILKQMGDITPAYVGHWADPPLRGDFTAFPGVPLSNGAPVKLVLLPLLYFISPEELPEHLQVTGPDDSKLNDDSYYENLLKWLRATFIEVSDKPITWEDKLLVKLAHAESRVCKEEF